MSDSFDPIRRYQETKEFVGYVSRSDASLDTYSRLGFKCGLEIHQQLDTEEKLFCRCPAGLYQNLDEFDAEVIRHMRPTLSEMGEYDGTALMERKTKKNIIYRIKNESACTYDIDDTPPFPINRQALDIAIEIALMLRTNIVGELHITRKQYLDGSIPTGFQRTAIVGIEGEIPLKKKSIGIIQLSVEEDACREVSDVGHWRVYTTDRLGIPLIETVTYPHMLTPEEAAEAAQYLRFLTRSSGKVRTGIGAAREDVNVSIDGGTRVEIKGVQHISWIPELTHNEGFRQKALLEIRNTLTDTIPDWKEWKVSYKDIAYNHLKGNYTPLRNAAREHKRLTAVNLPGFRGVLSFFTQPGQTFADEISGRLKVIACLEKPNMLHSEDAQPPLSLEHVRQALNAGDNDAQIIVWGSTEDVETAVETIEERCRIAFEGVPNETRKSLPDGTTVFERVLPGPDRMYPDTDSAPLPIGAGDIDRAGGNLPVEIRQRFGQLKSWRIPEDTYRYLLKCNLVSVIEKIVNECDVAPRFVGTLFGHILKHLEGQQPWAIGFSHNKVYGMLRFIRDKNLTWEIARLMLPVIYEHPNMDFESVLFTVSYQPSGEEDIIENLPVLREKFRQINSSRDPQAPQRWIMGQLSRIAVGNMPLKDLSERVAEELKNE